MWIITGTADECSGVDSGEWMPCTSVSCRFHWTQGNWSLECQSLGQGTYRYNARKPRLIFSLQSFWSQASAFSTKLPDILLFGAGTDLVSLLILLLFYMVLFLLLFGRPSSKKSKAPSFKIIWGEIWQECSSIWSQASAQVSILNMRRLMESDFWFDVTL